MENSGVRRGTVCLLWVGLSVAIVGAVHLNDGTRSSSGILHTVLASPGCSTSTLNGTYGWSAEGYLSLENRIAQLRTAALFPVAAAGTLHFDGTGGLTGGHTQNAGTFQVTDSYSGTYSLASNCTGTLSTTTFTSMIQQWNIVVVGGGEEIRFYASSPDRAVFAGSATKIQVP